jgi:hydroxyacyl-ACP dehydratase HTD2-like protein with hotdog domain
MVFHQDLDMRDNMDKEKIIEISNDVENKSNKDLFVVVNELYEEYEKTKELIINLTNHLENVEIVYNNVNDEIAKRIKK